MAWPWRNGGVSTKSSCARGCGIKNLLHALTVMSPRAFLLNLGALVVFAMNPVSAKTESLVLGGGCFWCTEAAYEILPGVKDVVSGYAGGKESNPTYEQVCAHATGHAEVIKIDYDPTQVSLGRLLDCFWHVHNPTQ